MRLFGFFLPCYLLSPSKPKLGIQFQQEPSGKPITAFQRSNPGSPVMEGMAIPRGCLYIEASLFDKCPLDRGISHRISGFKRSLVLCGGIKTERVPFFWITSNADCCFGSTQRMLICSLFNVKEQEESWCFWFCFFRERAHIYVSSHKWRGELGRGRW